MTTSIRHFLTSKTNKRLPGSFLGAFSLCATLVQPLCNRFGPYICNPAATIWAGKGLTFSKPRRPLSLSMALLWPGSTGSKSPFGVHFWPTLGLPLQRFFATLSHYSCPTLAVPSPHSDSPLVRQLYNTTTSIIYRLKIRLRFTGCGVQPQQVFCILYIQMPCLRRLYFEKFRSHFFKIRHVFLILFHFLDTLW